MRTRLPQHRHEVDAIRESHDFSVVLFRLEPIALQLPLGSYVVVENVDKFPTFFRLRVAKEVVVVRWGRKGGRWGA